MANVINSSRAISCADYFSASKCIKVVNVSMEKEGKASGNANLKAALALIGKAKFDFDCVSLTDNGLYMGYMDWTDSIIMSDKEGAMRDDDGLIMFEEGEVYGHNADDVFTPSEELWDGRIFLKGKMIDGQLRFRPRDMVKAFFAKYAGIIRQHNNAILEEKKRNAAKRAAKKAEKEEIAQMAQTMFEEAVASSQVLRAAN